MPLEAGTYITDLVNSNPPQSDSLTQAAGHLRLIKSALLNTFPNFDDVCESDPGDIDDTVNAFLAGGFVPTGGVIPYGGTTEPTGWLFCNGQSVLRATYANLFSIIGTTFGAVDGTHFTMPNMKDRFIVGKADMGGTTDAAIIDSLLTSTTLGATYDGEGAIDTITLVTGNIPSHTHSFSGNFSGTTSGHSADHSHSFSGNTSTNGDHNHSYTRNSDDIDNITQQGNQDGLLQGTTGSTTGNAGNHSHSFSGSTGGASSNHTHSYSGSVSGTTGSTGSGTAFTVAILPPSIVMNFLIKT